MENIRRPRIGICGVADFRSNMGEHVIDGLYDAARAMDVDLIDFCGAVKYSISEDFDLYKYYPKVFSFLNSENLDGLITWASSLEAFLPTSRIRQLHKSLGSLPMVSLGTLSLSGCPGVFTDNRKSLSLLIEHLTQSCGRRRIAFLGTLSRPFYGERLQGYRESLEAMGLPVDENLIYVSDRFSSGGFAECIHRIIQDRESFPEKGIDALVTVSDIVAEQAIGLFLKKGLRVPEDIAVVGFNNQIHSRTSLVPITTVDPHFYEKSFRAMEMLLEMLRLPEKKDGFVSVTYPATMVYRQSSGGYEDVVRRAGGILDPLFSPGVDNGSHNPVDEALSSLKLSPGALSRLSEAVEADLQDANQRRLLQFIRENFHASSLRSEEYCDRWQNLVSAVREDVLNRKDLDDNRLRAMEHLFHQARTLISTFVSYYVVSERHDAYKFNLSTQIALDFSFAQNGKEILDVVGKHLEDLGIPRLILVLQDDMLPEPGEGGIAYEFPAEPSYRLDSGFSGHRLAKGRLPVHRLHRNLDRGVASVMKILYHKGQFMGTALLEKASVNLAIYDLLCVLLSRSLYSHYVRLSRQTQSGEIRALIKKIKTDGVLDSERPSSTRKGLSVDDFLDYLARNLAVKTDLSRMAQDLGVSQSSLVKKARALTGYSVQSLHEKMKIERAKTLLTKNDDSIAEIADKLGFNNQSYFARVFKKHTGYTPRTWALSEHAPDGFI